MIETNYRAFISYNHQDRAEAILLQRKLEAYRVPRKLVDVLTSEGSVPRRLTPIFRDEECMAAGDLSDGVKEALKRSRFLIVVCSPDAAASEWVDREVRLFKQLHGAAGERRILAAVVRGESNEIPGAALDPARVMPKACLVRVAPDGSLAGESAEPLAADLRFGRRHARLGFLKLVSGLIGVGLDDLLDRDHRRKQNYTRSVAGLAASVAALTGGLAWLAIDARNEAWRQRNEAEGLIEFMLTDLKAKLDAVGRLDALDSVGKRALQYYAAQGTESLDADALGRRARAQLLVGEIDNLRGDLKAALAAYQEAEATTAEQLRRDPSNGQRIFDHAQAVFWVGYVAWRRDDLAKAEEQFRAYEKLARQLVALDPNKIEWRKEVAYAHNNLGSLYLKSGRRNEAIAEFEKALVVKTDILNAAPDDVSAVLDLGQSYSWLGTALFDDIQLASAEDAFRKEIALYDRLASDGVNHVEAQRAAATARIFLAETLLYRGKLDEAQLIADDAGALVEKLLSVEPSNTFWLNSAVLAYNLSRRIAEHRKQDSTALEHAEQSRKRSIELAQDPDTSDNRRRMKISSELNHLLLQRALSNLERVQRADAAMAGSADAKALNGEGQASEAVAEVLEVYGNVLHSAAPERAEAVWLHALALLSRSAKKSGLGEEILRLQLLIDLRRMDEANKLAERLELKGVHHPIVITQIAMAKSDRED
jgi:tetratricopeptide (TPR) repeat protein